MTHIVTAPIMSYTNLPDDITICKTKLKHANMHVSQNYNQARRHRDLPYT